METNSDDDAPVRAALGRLGPEDHVLLLNVHHIVTDGWSVAVFLRDLLDELVALAEPGVEDALTPSHFETVRSFVKGYRAAGPTLTVLRTSVGTAQSVAIALDKARWPEVIGTIAGDDTIFIATESGKAQRRLHDHLRTHFGR